MRKIWGIAVLCAGFAAQVNAEAVLTMVGTTVNKPFHNRANSAGALSGVSTRYDVVGFYPNANANCSVYATQEGNDFDGFINIYQGGFNPANATLNWIAGNDDAAATTGGFGIGTSHVINFPATVAQNWYVVTSGFNSGDEGSYSVTITCAAPATRVLPASDFNLAFTDGRIHALRGGRFEVSATWRDFGSNTGSMFFVPMGSDESGIGTFFGPTNFEVSIKVIDGCGLNNRYWVFYSATTNVEFTITVRDTATNPDTIRTYTNPLGSTDFTAVTDINAFATCP